MSTETLLLLDYNSQNVHNPINDDYCRFPIRLYCPNCLPIELEGFEKQIENSIWVSNEGIPDRRL